MLKNTAVTEYISSIFFSFESQWKKVLISNAKIYNGLYSGLQRIADGKAQRQGKIIKEWCIRTENKLGNGGVGKICRKKLLPCAESNDNEKCRYYAEKLLLAAKKAGLYKEEADRLVITESNINAYIEWDGNEIFEGDTVEVINPAWYQNGIIIEQGHCKVTKEDESGS